MSLSLVNAGQSIYGLVLPLTDGNLIGMIVHDSVLALTQV